MIKVIKGDICDLAVDAIVNAANNHLWMGAGVAGAIKRRGGMSIEAEAVAKGPIPVGEAVITGAGMLKAGFVIHAAAMGQDLATDASKVRLATRNALLRAEENALHNIAFPALGTGVGGLALDTAAKTMVGEVRRNFAYGSTVENVIFSVFDDRAFECFSREAGRDRIVCLGDSVTYGYPYGPEASWVALSSEMSGLNIVNEGINGDTTSGMLDRFKYDVLPTAPAFVVILGGGNDILIGFRLEKILDNIKALIEKVLQAGVCPVLVIPPPVLEEGGFIPRAMVGAAVGGMEIIGRWVKEFAGQEKLPVMDFHTPLLDPQTGKGNPHYFTDGAHTNREGYRELARAAQEVLNRIKRVF